MIMCKYCETDPDLHQGDVIIEHDFDGINADVFIIGEFNGRYYFQLNVSDTDDIDSSSVEINYCPMCGRKLNKE